MQSYIAPASTMKESWVFISDNDIVPEDDQNRLIHWRDVFLMAEFDIGDIANRLCDQSAARGFFVTQQRIFDACGSFCGRSGRTVRYYAETARFYEQEIRAEFSILPFSHFVLARYTGNRWREILEYAMAHPNISEDGLRHAFFGKEEVEEVSPPDQVPPGAATEYPQPIASKLSQPEPVAGKLSNGLRASSALSAFSGLLDQSEIILREAKLREETARKFTQLIAEFRSIIPAIARELSEDKVV